MVKQCWLLEHVQLEPLENRIGPELWDCQPPATSSCLNCLLALGQRHEEPECLSDSHRPAAGWRGTKQQPLLPEREAAVMGWAGDRAGGVLVHLHIYIHI